MSPPSPPRAAIVMYHYLREARPGRPALPPARFRAQILDFRRRFDLVGPEELLSGSWPPRPLMLTFDDGYREHYELAFPLLAELGLRGLFGPVPEAAQEGRVLISHQIQMLLALPTDPAILAAEIEAFLKDRNPGFSGAGYQAANPPGPGQNPARFFVRTILQQDLPPSRRLASPLELDLETRRELTETLFARHLTADSAALAAELYAAPAELKEMVRGGQALCLHGQSHTWLGPLPAEEQKRELDQARQFILNLGAGPENLGLCYPYGSYSPETISLARAAGLAFALTTRPQPIGPEAENRFTWGRYDAETLPPDWPGPFDT